VKAGARKKNELEMKKGGPDPWFLSRAVVVLVSSCDVAVRGGGKPKELLRRTV